MPSVEQDSRETRRFTGSGGRLKRFERDSSIVSTAKEVRVRVFLNEIRDALEQISKIRGSSIIPDGPNELAALAVDEGLWHLVPDTLQTRTII